MKDLKFISFLFVVSLGFLFTQCIKSDKDKIESVVRYLNNMSPYSPDPSMRMDGAEYIPEKTIKLKMTLLQDIEDDELDFYKNLMQDAMQVAYLNLIRGNPEMKTLRDVGAIFHFHLKTKKGIVLADIKITPEEYNKPAETDSPNLTGNYDNDIEPMLAIVVQSIKKQLPITFGDENSGIIMVDCESSGKELTYVYLLKDIFLEDIESEADRELFESIMSMEMKNMIRSDHSMKKMVMAGVKVKIVMKKEDGTIFMSLVITKDDIKEI